MEAIDILGNDPKIWNEFFEFDEGSCAGLGRFGARSSRRQLYHSQTSLGSRANASGEASSSGRKFFHSPSAPRKVGHTTIGRNARTG